MLIILSNKYDEFLVLTKKNNSLKRRFKPVGLIRNTSARILPEPEIHPTRILPEPVYTRLVFYPPTRINRSRYG